MLKHLPVFGLSVLAVSLLVAGFFSLATTSTNAAPGSVDLLAIDTNTAGNTDTVIGTIEPCVSVSDGATGLTFDLVAKGIDTADRIKGSQVDVDYDSSIISVTNVVAADATGSVAPNNVTMISRIQSVGGANFFEVSDWFTNPNSLTAAGADATADANPGAPVEPPPAMHESGDGVIGRITFDAVGVGITDLTIGGPGGGNDGLVDVLLIGGQGTFLDVPMPITTIAHAKLAVGVACPTPTPSPTPAPTTAQFIVNKDFSDVNNADVTILLICTNATVFADDNTASESDPANFTLSAIGGGGANCTATETVPPGYVAVQSDCLGKSGIVAGNVITCTIVNTARTETFNVIKDWVPNFAGSVTVGLGCTSGGVAVIDNTADEADDANFTVTRFNIGATCTATENLQNGYFSSGTNCQFVPIADGAPPSSCTFTNKTIDFINVTKDFSDGNAAAVTIAATCSDVNAVVTLPDPTISEGDDGQVRIEGFATSTTCSVTETNLAAGYTANLAACTNKAIDLDGIDETCGIINNATATINVTKDFSDGNVASVTATVNCVPAPASITPSGSQLVSEGTSPVAFVLVGLGPSTSCTVSESGLPSGYAENLAVGTCDNAMLPTAGSLHPCTLRNEPSTTTLRVTKDFVPDNGTTIDITVSCTSGNVAPALTGTVTEGTPTDFTVTAFDQSATCTVTEDLGDLPAGYEQASTTCTLVALVNAGISPCAFVNRNFSTIHIAKNFTDSSTAVVTIDISCQSVAGSGAAPLIITIDTSATESPADTADFKFVGFNPATATCTPVEPVTPNGYTKDESNCNAVPMVPGVDSNCTIVNTVNTVQITVDKTYVGAGPNPAVNVVVQCNADLDIQISPPNASADDPTPDAVFTLSYVDADDVCSVVESPVPTGYTANQSDCANLDVDVFPTTAAEFKSCFITNTLNTVTVTINKDFSDGNPSDVTVFAGCSSSSPNFGATFGDQTASESDSASWTGTGFNPGDTCSFNESPIPTGYLQNNSNCLGIVLQPGGTPSCTIVNTNFALINVSKDFSDVNAANVTVTVNCGGNGTLTAVGDDNTASEADDANFQLAGFTSPATCTATETVPAGYQANQAACAGLSVATGDTDACTIVNTLNSATVTISKDFTDKPGTDTTNVTLTIICSSGVQSAVDNTASEADAGNFTLTGFNTAGTTCTITETLPAGYTVNQAACANIAITHGSTPSCAIINTLNSATLIVYKDYSNDATDQVDIDITCTSGAVVDVDDEASEADSAEFTISGFAAGATCTAIEDPIPAGYSADQSDCVSVPITVAGPNQCTIVNTDVVHFTVRKQFSPAGGPISVIITLTCTSGTVIVDDGSASESDPADFRVTGFTAGTTCTATESVPANYVANQSDCQNVSTSDADCLIINTFSQGAPGSTQTPTPTATPRGGRSQTPTPTPTEGPSGTPSPTASPSPTPNPGRVTRTPIQ